MNSVQLLGKKRCRIISDEILKHVPQAGALECAFVSGSMVEGFSNSASDCDVYGVVEHDDPDYFHEINFQADGLRVGLILFTTQYLANIQKVLEENLTGGRSLWFFESIYAHRLITGIPLVEADKFHEQQINITAHMLSEHLAEFHFNKGSDALNKCIGNWLVDDIDSAIFNAQKALVLFFDVMINNAGSTSVVDKWRIHYAKQYLGESHLIYQRFMELTSNVPTLHSRYHKTQYIEEVARFAQCVIDYHLARKFFPELPFDLNHERLWGGSQFKIKQSTIHKNDLARVSYANNGAFFLHHTQAVGEVARPLVMIWLCINNYRTIDDIYDVFQKYSNQSFDRSQEVLEMTVRKYKEIGVIQ